MRKKIAVFIGTMILGITACGGSSGSATSVTVAAEKNDNSKTETIGESVAVEKTDNSKAESTGNMVNGEDIEVTMDVEGGQIVGMLLFDVNTNLPDETVLMFTLSRGDLNTDDYYMGQCKASVFNGIASSTDFSSDGEALVGDYDLCISMSIPSTQPDAVRNVIGEKGEKISGPLVQKSSTGDSNYVSALFTVNIDESENVVVSPSSDYAYTVFRNEE